MEQIANITRPCDVPDTGLLCDILWADPDPSITVGSEREDERVLVSKFESRRLLHFCRCGFAQSGMGRE